MDARALSPAPPPILHRYLLHFNWPNPWQLPTPVGVTAFSVEDATELIRIEGGMAERPTPTQVEVDVDLSKKPSTFWKAPVGPTNWRGVWYPMATLR